MSSNHNNVLDYDISDSSDEEDEDTRSDLDADNETTMDESIISPLWNRFASIHSFRWDDVRPWTITRSRDFVYFVEGQPYMGGVIGEHLHHVNRPAFPEEGLQDVIPPPQ